MRGPPVAGPLKVPLWAKPSQKMAPLHWKKLPAMRVKNTVFDGLATDKSLLDAKQLEAAMAVKAAPTRESKTMRVSMTRQSSRVQLLDPKRVNNISIALSRFKAGGHKLSPDEIANAVRHMDANILSGEMISMLRTCLPTSDEADMLGQYVADGQDASKLGNADQFVLTMSQVDLIGEKLRSWQFTTSLEDYTESILFDAANLSSAIRELHESTMFKDVLKLVLDAGNFLNAGSFRGGAAGFTIETLPLVATVKPSGSKTNLLRFITQLASEEKLPLLIWPDTMPHVAAAAKISMSDTREALHELKKEVGALDAALVAIAAASDADPYLPKLASFAAKAQEAVSTAEAQLSSAEGAFLEIAKDFAENTPKESAVRALEFLGIVAEFAAGWEKAIAQNAAAAAAAVKDAERAKKAEMRQSAAASHSGGAGGGGAGGMGARMGPPPFAGGASGLKPRKQGPGMDSLLAQCAAQGAIRVNRRRSFTKKPE